MADKKDKDPKNPKAIDPDQRFKYVGFDVHPGKIKDLFKSDTEKEKWVKKVQEKRKTGSVIRDKSSFDEPRVAGYEKIVLAVTSLLLIATLFMPWFSGHATFEIEPEATSNEMAILPDSSMMAETTDSTAAMMIEEVVDSLATTAEGLVEAETSGEELAAASEGMAATEAASEETADGGATDADRHVTVGAKDDMGFSSITSVRKQKEYRKEHRSASALASFGFLGVVFSSGIILKITGLLFLIYVLLVIFSSLYTLYLVFGAKGSEDVIALKLKKALKLNWIPLGIWFFCMVLSVVGASYSFNTSDFNLAQLSDSYGVGTYLGLLSYGFYVSLACFIMNAVKAVEI